MINNLKNTCMIFYVPLSFVPVICVVNIAATLRLTMLHSRVVASLPARIHYYYYDTKRNYLKISTYLLTLVFVLLLYETKLLLLRAWLLHSSVLF